MLDGWMDKLGALDVAALAAKVGLTEEQVRTGAAALMAQLSNGRTADGAAQAASADTGIDAGRLAALVPLIQQHLGGEGGVLGTLSGVFGQGGEGAPAAGDLAGQVGDFAKGLFGRK